MKQFEIKSHDGPGRYGKLGDNESPLIINKDDFIIAEDESSAYDVEKEVAEWSVNQTIEKAKKVEDKEIAVIQGSKYIDLRIKCLKELEKLGYNGFIIANADDLLLHPRDLVDVVVNLKKEAKPSSYFIFPFAELPFMPILTYMGIDGFLADSANYYSHLNVLQTPTKTYDLNSYNLFEGITQKDLEKKIILNP